MTHVALKLSRRAVMNSGLGGAVYLSNLAFAQSDGVKAPGAKVARDKISPLMQTVAKYIVDARDTALPDSVVEQTKLHLLDTLASMISGSALLPGQKAVAYVAGLGGTPEACVPGSSVITNAVNAALAGGMLAQADETDDSHEASLTHPGCGVVPAALAMGERQHADGVALIRAIALGYDICARASFSLGSYAFDAAGHSTHSYGPIFGAAAAAGSIARFNETQVRYLMSYAAQQASGASYQTRDTQHIEKSFDLGGMGARNGVAAATMVLAGMTGVDDAFSGPRNFFLAFGKDNPPEMTRDLGKTYEIVNTSIKKWTVGAPMQAALDSIAALIQPQAVKADDVAKLVIRLSHEGVQAVDNKLIPDICMQHMAAVMLVDGTVTFASAHDEARMTDPTVLEVRRRIVLEADDELDKVVPSRQAIVDMQLRSGAELHNRTTEVRGSPKNPMSRQEVSDKSISLMEPIIGASRSRELVAAVMDIERIKDLVALRPLLTV